MKAQTIGLDSIPSNLAIDLADELSSDVRGGIFVTWKDISGDVHNEDPVDALKRIKSQWDNEVDSKNNWASNLTSFFEAFLKQKNSGDFYDLVVKNNTGILIRYRGTDIGLNINLKQMKIYNLKRHQMVKFRIEGATVVSTKVVGIVPNLI